MKRSEMIELIAESILQTHQFGGDENEREMVRKDSYIRRIITADAALKAVEKAGMRPPYAEFKPLYTESIGFPIVKTLWAQKWEAEKWSEQ